MKKTDHYIVHSTVVDPEPKSSFGTSAPYRDVALAIKAAQMKLQERRYAFVTARDEDSSILTVIPVVDYPVARETHVPEHAQEAVMRLFADLDWTV